MNDFLHKVFKISETMKDNDKFGQIKDFSARLKRAKCINLGGGVGCLYYFPCCYEVGAMSSCGLGGGGSE